MAKVLLVNSSGSFLNLKQEITNAGFEVFQLPMIEVQNLSLDEIDLDIEQIYECDFIAITSTNAARWLVKSELSVDGVSILCLGARAKNYLSKHGYQIINLENEANSSSFAKTIIRELPSKLKILYLTGNLTDDSFSNKLSLAGFTVFSVCVYQTNFIQYSDLKSKEIVASSDYLVFSSPSTAKSYLNQFKLSNKKIISIGPSTSAFLLDKGIRSFSEAEEPDAKSVLNCLIQDSA